MKLRLTTAAHAVLTVLADTDGDGLPDIWETNMVLHPCFTFNPNNAADGALDADGDGMNNAAEYFAGTDPCDPASKFKAALAGGPGAPAVQFNAISNRTYTVQFTDSLSPSNWQKLGDVLARYTNHVEAVPDPNPGSNRIYRVVTPIQP